MRKWFLTVVIGAVLALPAWAQQKNNDDKATPAANADGAAGTTSASTATKAGLARASRASSALPEAPRPNPFPGSSSASDAPGRLLPRWEISGMYHYINFHPG